MRKKDFFAGYGIEYRKDNKILAPWLAPQQFITE